MNRVFETYRAFHEQGFIPIFVKDDLDTRVLLEGCLEAGMSVIEYTLRRQDAHVMIPWIRENYPDLHIIAGSTMDDERIVAQLRRRHPQLLSLSELDAIGVDGFVSMLGWNLENIRKYSPRRLVVPAAWTVTEAFEEMAAGAHLIKVTGGGKTERARSFRAAPTFDYCPIMITGGVKTPEHVREAFQAGAVTVASGFDVTLPRSTNITSSDVAGAMRIFLEVARAAREEVWPELAAAVGAERQVWLDALPHYHPFSPA